jgi:hydroxymethylglutaryl-CoA lyase
LGKKKKLGKAVWPKATEIFEVGPRDGLQAEAKTLDLAQKIQLVHGLVRAGVTNIEIGSFVKSDRIPQLANTEQLLSELRATYPRNQKKVNFWAFVPNEKGLERAIEFKVDGVGFFVATSSTFCKKNVNRSQKEILNLLPQMNSIAKGSKLKTRIYLSTITFCPYDGLIKPKEVFKLVEFLLDVGFTEIVLSDTTGDANPRQIRSILDQLVADYGSKCFSLHLHDTRGLALANIVEALGFGISRFDSSIAGLGGCPYAPGASGNLATEDLANMLLGMGLLKGVDLAELAKVGHFMESAMNRELPARMLRVLESKSVSSEKGKVA